MASRRLEAALGMSSLGAALGMNILMVVVLRALKLTMVPNQNLPNLDCREMVSTRRTTYLWENQTFSCCFLRKLTIFGRFFFLSAVERLAYATAT